MLRHHVPGARPGVVGGGRGARGAGGGRGRAPSCRARWGGWARRAPGGRWGRARVLPVPGPALPPRDRNTRLLSLGRRPRSVAARRAGRPGSAREVQTGHDLGVGLDLRRATGTRSCCPSGAVPGPRQRAALGARDGGARAKFEQATIWAWAWTAAHATGTRACCPSGAAPGPGERAALGVRDGGARAKFEQAAIWAWAWTAAHATPTRARCPSGAAPGPGERAALGGRDGGAREGRAQAVVGSGGTAVPAFTAVRSGRAPAPRPQRASRALPALRL
jgi:hypothetical protein